MNITSHNIRTPKTARYYIIGEPSSQIKIIWFVLHGYGSLAGEFIKQFEYLALPGSLVIAPEGLSRSYFGNKIGASWMTKEDRENEIADYVEYLDNLFKEVSGKIGNDQIKVNVLGFSQGVHTAARWFALSRFVFNKLLLCSSDFPKDTDFTRLKNKLKTSRMYYIYGNNDEYFTVDQFNLNKQLLGENGVRFESFKFNGTHIVDHDLIRKIADL